MPDDLPDGLLAALAQRGAAVDRVVDEPPRRFVHAGGWFGRVTRDPADEPRLAHEARARAVVGGTLPLRAPPIVAEGSGWTLEPRIEGGRPRGAAAADALVAAALELPRLRLPVAAAPAGEPGGRAGRALRLARMAAAGVRPTDVARARRTWRTTPLPAVASHGDFHTNNIVVAADGPWVVDWELCGEAPQGTDLLMLWATLEEAADRAVVLDAARRQAGAARRSDLDDLAHAVVVRTLAAVVDPAPGGVGDAAVLRGLLRELRSG